MKRRTLISSGGALTLSMALSACGGSSSSTSSGSAQVRFVNASIGYSALTFAIGTSSSTPAVNYGSASAYASYTSGTSAVVTNDAISGSLIASYNKLLDTDSQATLIAYGSTRGVKLLQLSDGEAAASSNYTKFRVLNLAPDAGTLAMYVTAETADISSSTPTVSSVAGESASSYVSIPSGTYRVRVTSATDSSDIRFDVSGVALSSTAVMSLALTSGPSGVLVQGLLITQGSTVSVLASKQSRVRVIASIADNALVRATIGSSTIVDGVRSPVIAPYSILGTGSLPVSVSVNGASVAVADLNAIAGTDYTMIVAGPANAPTVTVITEDNRLPAVASNCRIRLIHAASTLANSGLTLTANYIAVAQDVRFGTGSGFTEVASGSNILIDVANPLALASIANFTGVTLSPVGLYTVFILMGSGGPAGVLRRER